MAALGALLTCMAVHASVAQQAQTNKVIEISFQTHKQYANPFTDVELDALFTAPDGTEMRVPAFWAGGDTWKVRYASPLTGLHRYRTVCSHSSNAGLHGVEGKIEITPYTGESNLYRHGPIHIADDQRHFAHEDGRPFFWLGDTWWKNLCKRMTWEGFKELAADRRSKGFSVIQIVCGPYPDEDAFEPMWANEGGLPYHTRDYKEINVEYWDHADRRLAHLVDVELVPAIVGAWGRHDCNAMNVAGVEGLKRHWRYVIARYGAYPVFWILAGELQNESKWGVGPWGEVGRYVRSIDPYRRPITNHTGGGRRGNPDDDLIITYDMVGGSHDQAVAITSAIDNFTDAYSKEPPMPVLVGETCYEGHMQTGFQYVQRHMFWQYMLSGAAGHTYGAAGIWHASVEGDPGCASSAFGGRKVYDWTTWREGMNYPGATQLGLGKSLLEEYDWHRFEPHPEWAEEGSFAAGIPGEVRFIYQPRRTIYNWQGAVVKGVEMNVDYSAFYFDPATGRRFDQGKVKLISSDLTTFEGHTQPRLYEDDFDRSAVGFTPKGDAAAWKDYGTATQRKDGFLTGGKGMLSIVETMDTKDVMVSCASARSSAEAGLVLRFQDPDNYIVALYSPHFKSIFIHDCREGSWGAMLGTVMVPGIGPEIQLSAAVVGEHAAMMVSDGKQTWRTPPVKVGNTTSGKTGLWFYQIGEQQAFGKFEVSPMALDAGESATGQYIAPDLPSPQDWVLVLERGER
jgi:hypothetical protein